VVIKSSLSGYLLSKQTDLTYRHNLTCLSSTSQISQMTVYPTAVVPKFK